MENADYPKTWSDVKWRLQYPLSPDNGKRYNARNYDLMSDAGAKALREWDKVDGVGSPDVSIHVFSPKQKMYWSHMSPVVYKAWLEDHDRIAVVLYEAHRDYFGDEKRDPSVYECNKFAHVANAMIAAVKKDISDSYAKVGHSISD